MRYTPGPGLLQTFSCRGQPLRQVSHAAALLGAVTLSILATSAAASLIGAAVAATPPPLRVKHAAVASDHPSASAAGVELLRAGGNAADAACATALALGVGNPSGSGIGGGGFAIIYVAREKKVYALDFRERAPAALTPELFLRDGKPDPRLSINSGLAVAVPGEVRGLAELVRRWGKLPFGRCVAPAERFAQKGLPLTETTAAAINGEGSNEKDGLAFVSQIFTVDRPLALPLRAGERVRRPALAATLRRIRQEGAEAFYRGVIAEEIVKATRAAGGVLTMEDLAGYEPTVRTPLVFNYRGYQVHTMPPPSSGGIVIAQVLGILAARSSHTPPEARHSSAYLHILTEALKHGFADRARHLGDPDFVDVPVAKLLDPAYHRELAGRIKPDGILPQERYGWLSDGPARPPRDGGTTHLSVIDAEGNAVALTTTINLAFGARVVAGPTGILLNNEIDDFSMSPQTPNAFGLIGSDKNRPAPGKRPLSSMSPTVVLEGDRVKMVLGAAGGPAIISGTLQILLHVLDGNMDAQAASAAPRIHHQWMPPVLAMEPEFAVDVTQSLGRRGHKTQTRASIARVNVIVRTMTGLEAATEFRASGVPAGY